MLRLGSFSLFCVILGAGVWAQDEPPPAGGQQSAAVVVRATNENGVENVQAFGVSSNGGDFITFAPAAGMGGFMMGGNPMEASEFLLHDPGVQKELELVDEQQEQIRQMQQSFGQEMKAKIDEMMKSGGPEKNDVAKAIEEINQRRKERLSEILLPHQIDRLQQISFQNNVNNAGLGNALASKALMEKLGIDEEQKEKLKTKADELAKELEEKIAKLREEMRDELIDELSPEQQKKLKVLLGDKFEMENRGPMMIGPRAVRSGARQSPSEDN